MVPPKDTQDPDNAPDGHREHWSGVFHGLLKWRKTGKSSKQNVIILIPAIRPVNLISVAS